MLFRTRRQRLMFHVHEALKCRDRVTHLFDNRGQRVVVIKEDVGCHVRLHHVAVQVREHLLDPFLAFVGEKEHRYGLLAEGRVGLQSLMNRRAAVLSIVDDEISILKIHFEQTKTIGPDRLELDSALV